MNARILISRTSLVLLCVLIVLALWGLGRELLSADGGGSAGGIKLQAERQEDGAYQLTVKGRTGMVYVVERSSDLSDWSPFVTNTLRSITDAVPDAEGAAIGVTFYRIRLLSDNAGSDEILQVPPDRRTAIELMSEGNPPTVSITSPTNNEHFTPPAVVTVTVDASDPDGAVESVALYSGDVFLADLGQSPWTMTWTNNLPGTHLLTAVATDNEGLSATSSVVTVEFSLQNPTNYSGLQLWLNAVVGLTTNASGNISTWADQSGNANNATQTQGSLQPLWVADILNGQPVVRFDGVGDRFALPNFVSSMSAAEAFIVLKAVTNAPSSHKGLWQFGTPTYGSYYPDTSRNIQDAFGRTTTQNTGEPVQRVDSFHLYNVSSQSGEWIVRFNGKLHYQDASATVAFTSSPNLGRSQVLSCRRHGRGDVVQPSALGRRAGGGGQLFEPEV